MRDVIIAGAGLSVHSFAFPIGTPIMAISSGIYHVPEAQHFVSCDRPVNFNMWVTSSDRFDKHVPDNDFAPFWKQYQRAIPWPVHEGSEPGFSEHTPLTQSGTMPRNHSLLFGVQIAARLGFTRCIFTGCDLLEREHWPISDALSKWHPIVRRLGIEWVNASPISTLREWMPDYQTPSVVAANAFRAASPRLFPIGGAS